MLRAVGEGDLLRNRRDGMSETPAPAEASAAHAWPTLRAELVRFVASRVSDPSTADDIVHDVLLRALAALQGPEPPVHLRGWLYRATRNAIVDHYRSRRPSDELPEEVPGKPPESDESAERELAGCLEPLLATLRPKYRRALTLAEVDGLPQREIARREGLSLSGAKSRVQRARRMLHEALVSCCQIEVDRRGGVLAYETRGDGCTPCGEDGEQCSPSSGARARLAQN